MSTRAADGCEAAERCAAGLLGCFARPARAAAGILTLQLTRFYERRFRMRHMLSLRKLVHQRPQALVFDLEFPHVAKRFRDQASITFAPTIERSPRDQQLAIARALVTRPSLLILDEPTEGIEPNLVAAIKDVLASFKGKISLLLVEQYLDFAISLADAFVVLSRGSVAEAGRIESSSRELLTRYIAI
jgi:ABC-type branched-subunit amino acid transport system ATPase component